MLNRRLIVLFVICALAFGALGLRLAHLQITEGDHWREEMRAYVHHHEKLETVRGSILDRNGRVLAFDDACYDLAIDYRAMNLDDHWLTELARKRIKDETFADRAARTRRLAQVKAEIAAQVEAIPDALARMCDTSALSEPSADAAPREKILARFQEIRQTIADLRQDHWSRAYNADEDRLKAAAGDALDADFHESLREEHIEHTIIPHISNELMLTFRTHAEEYPGLVVVDSHTRVYPFKRVACHLLGTLRDVDGPTLKKNRFVLPNLLADDDRGNLGGYLPGDRMGEMGAEKVFEPLLRGIRGVRLIEIGTDGQPDAAARVPAQQDAAAEAPAEESGRQVDPVVGQNVRLTLDVGLQKDLEDAIGDPARGFARGEDGKDHSVALVVLSLDGQVLAMISTPGYDPNTIDATRLSLNQATVQRPLANRALEAYRPGSTIKPLVAAAALTDNVITPATSVTCVGYLFPGRPTIFKCAEVHGTVDLVHAISESCNVYFYNVGDKLGAASLAGWFSRYGFGRDTGFELPDSNGVLLDIKKAANDPETLRNEARFMGIGEGPIDVTPLQMASAYVTLLRGGQGVAPRILADAGPKASRAFTISPEAVAVVKEGMRGTITEGTGKAKFRGFKLAVGGKTGTADVGNKPVFDDAGNPVYDHDHPLMNADGTPRLGPDKKPLYARAYERGTHAWFVGFAPAEQPKFVVVALNVFGGHGANFAAPLVREAFLELEKHGYLPAEDMP